MEQRMDTSWCTALLQLPASLPAEANEHQPTGPSSLTNTWTEGVQRSAGILSMLSRQINPETDMIKDLKGHWTANSGLKKRIKLNKKNLGY